MFNVAVLIDTNLSVPLPLTLNRFLSTLNKNWKILLKRKIAEGFNFQVFTFIFKGVFGTLSSIIMKLFCKKSLIILTKKSRQVTFPANISCSKSAIMWNTWNMFKPNNKNTWTTSLMSFWCFYFKLGIYFTPFFSVSIVTLNK